MAKRIETRISNKHDFEINWVQAKGFVPLDGELIIYDKETDKNGNILTTKKGQDMVPVVPLPEENGGRTTPIQFFRIKIGDGKSSIDNLPFFGEQYSDINKILDNIKDGEGNGALEQLHDSETWTGIDAEGNEVSYETKASGKFSAIYGGKSYAEGGRSLAGGTKSVAKGSGSVAFGDTNYAGDYATAFGYQTRALGAYSHTEGRQTVTEESNAHAEGSYTKAKGNSSHAEGSETVAEGLGSHAEGLVNEAIGEGSHAEGINTLASGQSSHSEGEYAYATGTNSHAEGGNTFAKGRNSHAEGSQANAYGENSHAEGSLTHSNGENSHAEGDNTIADGNASHAEGTNTKASQDEAHAEGWETEASGHHSHSEGQQTKAIGDNSHAGGRGTIAAGEAQTAIGRYNKENSDALFIIGNGDDNENRKNAFVINSNGSIGGEAEKFLVGKTTEDGGEIFNDYENNKAIGGYSTAKGYDNIAGGKGFCIKNIVDGLDYETVISEMSIQATNSYTFSGVTLEEGATYRLKISGTVSLSGEPDVEVNIDEDYTAFYEEYFDLVALMIEARFADLPYNGGYSSINSILTIGHAKNDSNYSDLSLTIRPTGSYTDRSVNFNLTISLQKIGVSSSTKNIEISDATGIEVNDIFSLYSAKLPGNFDFVGKVLEIDGNLISVDNYNNSNLLTMLNTLEGNVDGSSSEYIWFPNKPNLNGDITMGTGASASGYSTKAVMVGAHTEGYNTIAAGKYAHAEGNSTIAGYASHSEGIDTQAIARQSHAEGKATKALKDDSHAEGNSSIADGYHSHAEGLKTKTEGTAAHSEGSKTQALAEASHSEGKNTIANGIATHAEGESTKNYAKASHTEGFNTKVGKFNNDTLITETTETSLGTHAEGFYTQAQENGAHAEGEHSKAYGRGTHSEGMNTKAQSLEYESGEIGGTHAEGYYTEAIGVGTHSEGYETKSSGRGAHAEGRETIAQGQSAHAEGHKTTARGYNSHAEGSETIAHGMNSHSSGKGTQALVDNQTVVGTYNVRNYNSTALFVVGNGTSDNNRKDAFVVNADGTATIQTAGTNDDSVVNLGQLKTYVSENGKSSWDAQSEMLFETGDILINNQQYTPFENPDFFPSESSIIIGRNNKEINAHYSAIDAFGFGAYIPDETLGVKALNLGADGINYSDSPDAQEFISWKELISAGNATKYLGQDEQDYPLGDITIKNSPFNENWEDKSDSFIAVGQSTGWGGGHITKITHDSVSVTENASDDYSSLKGGSIRINGGEHGSTTPSLILSQSNELDEETGNRIFTNVEVTTKGITHNNKSITWDGLFTTINNFKDINLTDYVKNTDYATGTKAGIIKADGARYGFDVNSSTGYGYIVGATNAEIDAKQQEHRPIVPSNLDYAVKSVTYDKEEIDTKIANIESVPNYVLEEAKAVSDKVIANRGANSLVLLMGSDFHVSANDVSRTAIKHMGQGMDEIRNYITPDAVVLLGDYNYAQTPMNKEQGIEDMKLCRKYVSDATKGITTIWLNGNHDYYSVSNSTSEYRISDDMVYALVGSNTTNTVVDTQNIGRNYGYVDFEKQKIRLIYLNTTDINGIDYTSHLISTVQGQWFISIALDLSDKEDEANWGVIVCAHIPLFDNPQIPTVLGHFVDRTSGRSFSKDYDFTKTTAKLIGVFHGHMHNFKVNEKQTEGGNLIKYICIPNAVPNRENPYTVDKGYKQEYDDGVAYPKTADTAEDTSFNAVIIDKDNKAIHAICYGAGYDRVIQYDITEEPEQEIINLIPISTDASGAIYGEDYDGDGVNDGYKKDTRIGSDGTDRTGATGKCATGFIPITPGDILYFSNCELVKTETYTNNQIACYTADKTYVGTIYMDTISPDYYTFTFDENNNLIMLNTTGIHAGTAYVRISANYIGADSVITINQEIT